MTGAIRPRKGRSTVKTRLIGALLAIALVGVLATGALGGQAKKAATIKVGVSLAG